MLEVRDIGLGTPPVPPGDIFITGGSGRIGTCLRQRLRPAGYNVRFTDIVEPADGDVQGFVRTDLADQDGMAEAMQGARAVIHLAGHPRDIDWPVMVERNYTGAYNAVTAARRAGVKTIIYASSNQAFGLHPADTVLSADLAPRPAGLYGISKVFGEAMLRAEAEAFGLIAFAWRICTFKPEPTSARDLRLWHSWDDAARLVDKCLRWTEPGFNVIWGVSGNTRVAIDDPVARRIGYMGVDNAEDHVARLQASGVDTAQVSEWAYLGGDKATGWMSQGNKP
ncbi:NAD-dependent epimerase/dehydratase family protein [Glacieibacterium frigidum]|uniref:NAD(P)-dependent oxidoreductase n=1 Tax=Glacieibacterium frigidum TaxID=2593303 RepID=A0A552UGI7_9SPHN|nr:NAD(P)-dependent oxidoreductase [Glacieibacterium frigidum]TRW17334.1 NAD(P)-dependent oxidoreductase [Glacieibacterium frigidum]